MIKASLRPPVRRWSSADADRPEQNRQRHRADAPPSFSVATSSTIEPMSRRSGLGDDRIDQRASDAPAAPPGQHAKRQQLDLAAEIARQDEADKAVPLPRQIAKSAGQCEDPLERRRVPRLVGEAGAVHRRERHGRVRRNWGDAPGHRSEAEVGRGRVGRVTSGGRR